MGQVGGAGWAKTGGCQGHDSMPNKPNRVAIYARVSTLDQTTSNQLIDLRQYCHDRGWTIAEEFVDTGISGSKARRPALDRLMNKAKKRQVDVVLVRSE